ncbi:apolipoprotein N-acyltransferase [Neptunitalea lumnitzerae]|uniref:Apolipoprotein N-acyltransferase n=1 Tax=Neptunitalea lumnitzerae TaxID=2965509 RepID=A0ABQ5MNE2_9FLAO|nr:apolipoprotein N-acyltransferase [Neptunitalea sp. Y10]GLB50857.1 apolipoprotein N-acyltransferase [Neptunitalea sp. Y10]
MKNPYTLAIISGVLLALAWPTYGVSLIIFFSFVPLLYAAHAIRNSEVFKKKLKVFAVAYLTFLIWNAITTWWIYFATPYGMLFAVLVNSLLMTLVFLLYNSVAKRLPQKLSLIFLPAIWLTFEKFHLNWDFSWPWLNLGNVFATSTNYIQWYEYTGSFGGSLWVWVVNIAIFKLVLKYATSKSIKDIQKNIVVALLLIALPIALSLVLKMNYKEEGATAEAVILQPNIDPYSEKYNTSNIQISRLLLELTAEKITDNTSIIIAPETVFADNTKLSSVNKTLMFFRLREYLKQYPNADLLAGISLFELIKNEKNVGYQTNKIKDGLWFNDYNSAFFMNGLVDSVPLYHKSKLVVGVENFPYKWFFEPLMGDMMLDLGGTVATKTTQEDRTPFTGNDYRVAPIICYESVYGEYVSKFVRNRADFLAIITNDAWWGNTQGHKQHLNYARLRAIETRRSIIRSANTGISAVINQKGDIEQQLGYDEQGVLKSTIHKNQSLTFYVKYGDYIARIAIFLSALGVLFAFTRKRPS